ncbi:MAG TPA: hypothetical protein VM925_20075, partial [Labilithrix sp.]|nr:hypothetical protein [Labilithrix sp.]
MNPKSILSRSFSRGAAFGVFGALVALVAMACSSTIAGPGAGDGSDSDAGELELDAERSVDASGAASRWA